MELGGRAMYHAKVVLVKDKENKRTRKASPTTNSPRCARNWPTCSCVLLPLSSYNLENSGILALAGMGYCQTGDRMAFDMIGLL
jgi:hypothetical protein